MLHPQKPGEIMPLSNTPYRYGGVARTLHWLMALLILTAIGLALYIDGLPRGSDSEVARVALLFQIHKSVGLAAFATALIRILWAFVQPKPVPLHPERRLETFAAEVMHWALYGAMLVMPLSGWVTHAASTGFAPIPWPFGQGLPFVPKSPALSEAAGHVHGTAAVVLYLALGAHVLGALKHVIIDKDATLARMLRGTAAGPIETTGHRAAGAVAAPLIALLVWVGVIGTGFLPAEDHGPRTARAETLATPTPSLMSSTLPAESAKMWNVVSGSLGIAVLQMGSEVTGSFADWSAAINYDDASRTGQVTVTIPVTSLTLGSVTQQALGTDFFDATSFPEAVFTGDIAPSATGGEGLEATGTLALRGATIPLTLPFILTIEGDTATMQGSTSIDRRAVGMGANYPDEGTVGFNVRVDVNLIAKRAQ
jgi:cytochrome b561/polyisoprenoid-binding protein YceI